LGTDEQPLMLFKELDRQGKKPMFMLRKVSSFLKKKIELGKVADDQKGDEADDESDIENASRWARTAQPQEQSTWECRVHRCW
jgi:hypothetical protein